MNKMDGESNLLSTKHLQNRLAGTQCAFKVTVMTRSYKEFGKKQKQKMIISDDSRYV